MIVPSKADGIALCSALILVLVFIVVGNVLTIVLFAVNKTLRKKSLLLVINMAFADLMLGALSLPIYIYDVGAIFQLWTGGFSEKTLVYVFFLVIDGIFTQASLISAAVISCERFYAVFWPLKHRTLYINASIPHCYFYGVETSSPYFRGLDCIELINFTQKCCVCLDAIRLGSNIRHMRL